MSAADLEVIEIVGWRDLDGAGTLVRVGVIIADDGDVAPDQGHGTFAYQVLAKLTLTVGAFTTSPTPAKAGKSFSAGLAVTESDTSAGVDSGTIICAATIAGKAVRVKTKRLVDGVAVCVWSLPKTARGKTIRGSIAVAVQGTQTSRAFAARIS